MKTKTLIVCLAAGFLTLGQPARAVTNPATVPSHTASFESRHHAALSTGQRYSINFSDIDGRTLSTADDHVTVLVLTTPEDLTRARAVADNVPYYCLGNEKYRMITVLRLTQVGRPIAMMFVRHRIDEEAKRLQTRYNAKKIRASPEKIFTLLPILTAPYRRGLARNRARPDFTSLFSAGTENYCSSGTMCRALKNWLRWSNSRQYFGTLRSISSDHPPIPPARL